MNRTPLRKIVGWLAGAVGILALVVSGIGTAAADEHMPGPRINTQPNPTPGSTPNCVSITWEAPLAPGEDIDGYLVTREIPSYSKDVAENRNDFVCGQDQDTTATFKVCAVYVSDEEEPVKGCSSANLSTTKAGIGELEPQPQAPKPTPKIVQSASGVDWIDFRWETSPPYEYDHYIIFYWPQGGPHVVRTHDDDGTWGYDKVTGLQPGTTYEVQIQLGSSGGRR
jgi:Fibronectin type III domain